MTFLYDLFSWHRTAPDVYLVRLPKVIETTALIKKRRPQLVWAESWTLAWTLQVASVHHL